MDREKNPKISAVKVNAPKKTNAEYKREQPKKTLLQKANQAFRENNFLLSINLYERILDQHPELESIIKFNLSLAKIKLTSAAEQNERLGDTLKIILFNTNYKTKNLHITRAIYKAIQRHNNLQSTTVSTYLTLIDDCRAIKPDLLLCIDGQRINQDILIKARSYAKQTVLWTFDDPYTTRHSIKHQHLFDIVFSNDKTSVSNYKTEAYHLPLASHEIKDFNVREQDSDTKQFDILFCGTAWPNRVEILNNLLAARPNLKYKICLPYNRFVPDLPLNALPISSYVHPLNFTDFIKLCQMSKIVLGLHRVFGENPNLQFSTTPGPRVFEVAGCKAFQISDNNAGVEDFFDQEAEIPVYDGLEDLVNKIDLYLGNKEKRKELAGNCYKKVIQKHTYINRLDFIISKLLDQQTLINNNNLQPIKKKPRLLYCVHNTIKTAPVGGLEIHQDVLAKNLKEKYEIYFIHSIKTPENAGRKFLLTDSEYNEIESTIGSKNDYSSYLADRQVEKWFSKILANYNFSIIHFFHFINQIPSLAFIARALGVPYVVSIHDFFVACRSFNLINHKNEYCIAEIDTLKCDTCLAKKYETKVGSQTTRRSFYREVLEKARCLIYMSPSTQEIIETFYPSLKAHKHARVHGAPLPVHDPAHYRKRSNNETIKGERLKIVVPGNLALHKGGIFLVEALSGVNNESVEFHFWGHLDKNIEKRLKDCLPETAVFNGPYSPGELPYNTYDASLHLSIWPETYCQTLSEAWAARIVPICTDIGAFTDRVIDGVNGVLVDYKKPETLTWAIRDLARNPQKINEIKRSIDDALFIDQEQHALMYDEAYINVLSDNIESIRTSSTSAEDDKREGFGLDEIQVLLRKTTWHNVGSSHPEDTLVLPGWRQASKTDKA